eukprot:gene13909-4861_t
MADRKAELERKRRKLEEMKKAREEKKKAEKAAASAGVQKASLPGPIASQSDIDKLLEDIDLPSSSTVVASPQIASQDSQSISSEDSKPTSPAPQRPVPKLSVAHLNSINVPPKEMVSYTKETQTIEVQPVEPEEPGSIGIAQTKALGSTKGQYFKIPVFDDIFQSKCYYAGQ